MRKEKFYRSVSRTLTSALRKNQKKSELEKMAVFGTRVFLILMVSRVHNSLADTTEAPTGSTKCTKGFYLTEATDTDPVPKCEPCDRSCLSFCRSEGPKGCEVCRDGYTWEPDYGCLDIDECHMLGYNPCHRNSFCVNTEGHYECFACDKACDGCDGDGPDFCKKCAKDYSMVDGVCRDQSIKSMNDKFEYGRYATYLGLCVATCIIFQKNIWIASIIGALVAAYITLAEYTVRNQPVQSPIEEAIMKAQGFG